MCIRRHKCIIKMFGALFCLCNWNESAASLAIHLTNLVTLLCTEYRRISVDFLLQQKFVFGVFKMSSKIHFRVSNAPQWLLEMFVLHRTNMFKVIAKPDIWSTFEYLHGISIEPNRRMYLWKDLHIWLFLVNIFCAFCCSNQAANTFLQLAKWK